LKSVSMLRLRRNDLSKFLRSFFRQRRCFDFIILEKNVRTHWRLFDTVEAANIGSIIITNYGPNYYKLIMKTA
jgi:hypothetical protein